MSAPTQSATQGRESSYTYYYTLLLLALSTLDMWFLEAQTLPKEASPASEQRVVPRHWWNSRGLLALLFPSLSSPAIYFSGEGKALVTHSRCEDIRTLNPTFLPSPRKRQSAGSSQEEMRSRRKLMRGVAREFGWGFCRLESSQCHEVSCCPQLGGTEGGGDDMPLPIPSLLWVWGVVYVCVFRLRISYLEKDLPTQRLWRAPSFFRERKKKCKSHSREPMY